MLSALLLLMMFSFTTANTESLSVSFLAMPFTTGPQVAVVVNLFQQHIRFLDLQLVVACGEFIGIGEQGSHTSASGIFPYRTSGVNCPA